MKKNKYLSRIISYEIFVTTLALISIILVILDLSKIIVITKTPFIQIDMIILLFFWIDYIYFFIRSRKKKEYFKKNIFGLIAILPFNEILTFFRIFRIIRFARFLTLIRFINLTKFLRLIRAMSFIMHLKPKFSNFIKTNGFIYIIYCNILLIFSSAILISYIENKNSFYDALWWSFVTASTVGYGDIAPKTPAGRIIAVILMIFGIGFLSMLTSTITTYFTRKFTNNDKHILTKNNRYVIDKAKKSDELYKEISELNDDQKEVALNIIKLVKNNSNIDIKFK